MDDALHTAPLLLKLPLELLPKVLLKVLLLRVVHNGAPTEYYNAPGNLSTPSGLRWQGVVVDDPRLRLHLLEAWRSGSVVP